MTLTHPLNITKMIVLAMFYMLASSHQKVGIMQLMSAEPKGKMFLALDTVSLDYSVPISEIEDTVDFLTLKVATMKYATNLENLKPITLSSGNIDYTYFQTPLPLHMARTVCENYRLSPLSITDISRYFHIPYPLLFHFQILTTGNRITCLTPSMVISEQQCLDDLQYATQLDLNFPQQQALKEYILNNVTAKTNYIVMNQNKFSLTPSHYGMSACLGEIPVDTSDSVKRLHEHFFTKLAEIFSHIFDTIETVSYRISETILTIAAEEDDTELLPANVTDIDQKIKGLIPLMLPNVARQDIEETSFEAFFTKIVNKTEDTALGQFRLSKTGLSTLSQRKKSILYASLLQFDNSVKRRINRLTQSIMNSTETKKFVPNTFLFSTDQSAYSFKLFVQNILPM